jgi:hypothetical protein
MADSLIIVWRDQNGGERCRWDIRGLREDGAFYGCAKFYGEMRNANLHGSLSPQDNAEAWRLATGILEQSPNDKEGEAEESTAWDGMLAKGSYSAPTAIYRYHRGDEQHSSSADDFTALTTLLGPYVRSACIG